ncbi:MAG TPA: hypothetical protein VFT26_05070 [Pyrinomonadaceae bacterium]|nr:hypothetical protein [Pyrinomonadaceae bacterium]
MTNAALVVAGAASGAGVLAFVAVKVRALRNVVANHSQRNWIQTIGKNIKEQGEKREGRR